MSKRRCSRYRNAMSSKVTKAQKVKPDSKYTLLRHANMDGGYSPYRLLGPSGKEVSTVNGFLDAQAARGLSPRSLRAYGYSLLNFWKWLATDGRTLSGLSEADLLEYIRFQRKKNEHVAARTINHRLGAVCCLYRFHCGRELPGGRRSFRARSHPYCTSVASETGYLYPWQTRLPRLRVKAPRRAIVPLTREEVRAYLASLRTWRDLALTGLMLFCGLRSREVLELTLEDVSLSENEARIRGKGDKERVVPLHPQVVFLLRRYLEVERPRTSPGKLFVSLKGQKRGKAMTPSGLRALFRHHRKIARVAKANPHRFRHSFGHDMVQAGISLPALMKLMGHSSIITSQKYYLRSSDANEKKAVEALEGLVVKEGVG